MPGRDWTEQEYRVLLKWAWAETFCLTAWFAENLFMSFLMARKGSLWAFFWAFLCIASGTLLGFSGMQVEHLQKRLREKKTAKTP